MEANNSLLFSIFSGTNKRQGGADSTSSGGSQAFARALNSSTTNNNTISRGPSTSSSRSSMSFDDLTYSTDSSDVLTLTSEQVELLRSQQYLHQTYQNGPVLANPVRGGNTTVVSHTSTIATFQTEQQQDNHRPTDYGNVYRPGSMIGRLLNRDLPPTSPRQSEQDDDDDTHHQRHPHDPNAMSVYRCLASPRVILTVAICVVIAGNLLIGSEFFERVWELGLSGMHAQRFADRVQVKLLNKPKKSKKSKKSKSEDKLAVPLTPLNIDSLQTASSSFPGCEATIMLLRHCEKGSLKAHCNYLGYERSVYLASLFGNAHTDRWPAPVEIYALNKGRKHKKVNLREEETVEALAAKHHIKINNEYSVLTASDLAEKLLTKVTDGALCGRLVVVSWKHSDLPLLAQLLGCGPVEGCPVHYKGSDFDSVWLIRYVFADFHGSTSQFGPADEKWNVFGSVQNEQFDPLAFSKSVGDYPPGGKTADSGIATWSSHQVFFG